MDRIDQAARNAFDRGDQRLRKRQAVLRVAATAFNRRGFANTSMDDVANALGVSKPTLYQYFKSKQEILAACHHLVMDYGEAGLSLAHSRNGTGLERLTVYLGHYMRGIFGDFGTCPVLTDVESLAEEERAEVVTRRARISAATVALISEGIKDGSIAECNARLASLFVLGAVNWIPVWYRESGPNTPDEIAKEFTRLMANGLSA